MDAVLSLSDFKAEASQLLKQIHENSRSLVITQNGRATAVVQDYEQFQRQREALLMLKLMVQGEADIQNGELIPHDEVFSDLREQLEARKQQDEQ
ncbi:MAG: type II toxin-antitoxin system Phd/YefM family antitoxin [Gammaproteobacteria bacterium]|nr:type II toxin-antitoxin system Phd/YefM family antitoxin [Gammaproteobacteria bacterium]